AVDPARAAAVVLGLVDGLSLQLTFDPEAFSVAEGTRLCGDALERYLGRGAPPWARSPTARGITRAPGRARISRPTARRPPPRRCTSASPRPSPRSTRRPAAGRRRRG